MIDRRIQRLRARSLSSGAHIKLMIKHVLKAEVLFILEVRKKARVQGMFSRRIAKDLIALVMLRQTALLISVFFFFPLYS